MNAELEVIPIFGDLGVDPREKQFVEAHKYNANQVAEHIAERFGGRGPARLTFRAFIPPNIGRQELEVIRRYVRSDWSYQIVFGVEDDEGKLLKEGRIHQAGTILWGLGAVERTSAWIQYARTVTDTDLRRMGKHIVGDIAQRFVTIEGVDAPLPRELQAVAVMNSRVTGLSPRHCQALARRHADGELPGLGVVIVAGGADKAAVTLAAVRSSAVNHLIVGEDLAAALLRLKLRATPTGTPRGGSVRSVGIPPYPTPLPPQSRPHTRRAPVLPCPRPGDGSPRFRAPRRRRSREYGSLLRGGCSLRPIDPAPDSVSSHHTFRPARPRSVARPRAMSPASRCP